MALRYADEEFEDKIYKEFYDAIGQEEWESWGEVQTPIRSFIKWAIITGKFKPHSLKNIDVSNLAALIEKLLVIEGKNNTGISLGEAVRFTPNEVKNLILKHREDWWKV